MIGLTKSASYRSANAGHIPTIPAGRGRIVPRLIWERMLGIEPAAETEMRVTQRVTERKAAVTATA